MRKVANGIVAGAGDRGGRTVKGVESVGHERMNGVSDVIGGAQSTWEP